MSSQNGNFKAYKAEYRDSRADHIWRPVPTKNGALANGQDVIIPGAIGFDGIAEAAKLQTEAQAYAIAWLFQAYADARGEWISTRVRTYELHYRIDIRELPTEG